MVIIPAGLAVERMRTNPSAVTDTDLSLASCLLVVVVAVAGAAVQAIQIVLRFINIGVINMTFRIYGIVVNLISLKIVLGSQNDYGFISRMLLWLA